MKLILSALDHRLVDAWRAGFEGVEAVEVHHGSILDLDCDALVSPANSYGIMDGGIDQAYVDHFGVGVQDRTRLAILKRHHGELLVGAADIVETGAERPRWMIAAPTMRVPMALGRETVAPYLAMRAALLLARHGAFPDGPLAGQPVADHVKTLAFPGLGTGVGRVPPETCARQMRAAVEEHLLEGYRLPTSWAEASERHQLLYTDRPGRLQ